MENGINIQDQDPLKKLKESLEIEMEIIANTKQLVLKEIIPIHFEQSVHPKYSNKPKYACKICEKTTNCLKENYMYYFKFVHEVSFENYITLVCSICLKSIEHVFITIKKYNSRNVFKTIIESIFFIDLGNINYNTYVFLPENIQTELVDVDQHSSKSKTYDGSYMYVKLQLKKLFEINLLLKCFFIDEKIMNYEYIYVDYFNFCMDMINTEYLKYNVNIHYIIVFKFRIYQLLWKNMKLEIYFMKTNMMDNIRSYQMDNIRLKKHNVIKKKSRYYSIVEMNLILLHALLGLKKNFGDIKLDENAIAHCLKQYFELPETKQIEIQIRFEEKRNIEVSYYESIIWLFKIIDYEKKLLENDITKTNFVFKIKNLKQNSLILFKNKKIDGSYDLQHKFIYKINKNNEIIKSNENNKNNEIIKSNENNKNNEIIKSNENENENESKSNENNKNNEIIKSNENNKNNEIIKSNENNKNNEIIKSNENENENESKSNEINKNNEIIKSNENNKNNEIIKSNENNKNNEIIKSNEINKNNENN